MKINQLPEVGDILRSLIGHAGNIILEDEQSRRPIAIGSHFLHIDNRPISDAPYLIEPLAPLALDFFLAFGLAAQ